MEARSRQSIQQMNQYVTGDSLFWQFGYFTSFQLYYEVCPTTIRYRKGPCFIEEIRCRMNLAVKSERSLSSFAPMNARLQRVIMCHLQSVEAEATPMQKAPDVTIE